MIPLMFKPRTPRITTGPIPKYYSDTFFSKKTGYSGTYFSFKIHMLALQIYHIQTRFFSYLISNPKLLLKEILFLCFFFLHRNRMSSRVPSCPIVSSPPLSLLAQSPAQLPGVLGHDGITNGQGSRSLKGRGGPWR